MKTTWRQKFSEKEREIVLFVPAKYEATTKAKRFANILREKLKEERRYSILIYWTVNLGSFLIRKTIKSKHWCSLSSMHNIQFLN